MLKTCEGCQARFDAPHSFNRFCTKRCAGEARRRRITVNCSFCDRAFEVPASRLKTRVYCSRSCPGPTVSWSNDLAYLVGLIATDGHLQSDGTKRIAISASDRRFLKQLKCLLPRSSIYGPNRGNYQLCTVWPRLYDFLLEVGLTPRKSLTMGRLNVPPVYFASFLRGVIDGDGTVIRQGRYAAISITSYAPEFRQWLCDRLRELDIKTTNSKSQQSVYIGSPAVRRLAPLVWTAGCLHLTRKHVA